MGALLGFANLNKPAGVSSHDCINRVRRSLGIKRVGHGGTLDPLATGVLPVAVGRATRLLRFLPEGKAYRATIRLGVRTATDDLEGEALERQPVPALDAETIAATLARSEGEIAQQPPAYSAIKQHGKRAYELARAGQAVAIPARTVRLDRIRLLDWRVAPQPELKVAIDCGPGTYVRALARDVGAALGTVGTLAALVRTASCGFELEQSVPPEQLERQASEGSVALVPPERGLAHLAAVVLPSREARRWCQGQTLAQPASIGQPGAFVRVQDEGGGLLGIGKLAAAETLLLKPEVVLAPG